jgi:hypothetical protein
MRGLWREVAEIVARGGSPVVTMPVVCEIITPPHPRGRPRLHPEGARRGLETGYALVTSSGRPMRCRHRGCQRTLRKNATAICCSSVCAEQLHRECSDTIDALEGRLNARHFATFHGCRHQPWLNQVFRSDAQYEVTASTARRPR